MLAEVVLGVDIGTTATKVAAIDATAAAVAMSRREYTLQEPGAGQVVQNPNDVLAAVIESIKETVDASKRAGAEVIGVAFSSAMHSLIGLDEDGRPLTPSITWADERAADQATRLRNSKRGPGIQQRTGTPLHAMSPLAKLMWFREQSPELMANVRRWVGIKEYVLAHLAGQYVVDVSVASGTGMFAFSSMDWDEEALGLAGIDAGQLSTLSPTTSQLYLRPQVRDELGLKAGVPVILGAGDGPLANLGAGAVRPGVAACSIGTSGAIRVAVERPGVDAEGSLFCYALTSERWVVGGAINNGGVILPWLGDILGLPAGEQQPAALLQLAAQAPPGSDGLLMLPYLYGERAPHWDGHARGGYIGLTHAHRREHLARAAIEGVCLQLATVLEALRAAGREVQELRASGGFAQSPFWRQLLTDVLGFEVHFPYDAQGSSVGAALLGLVALGRIADIDAAADLIQIEEVRRPDVDAAKIYRGLRPIFTSLYDALTPANDALRLLEQEGP